MNYLGHYDSPLGAMTMASDGEMLTGLWFDGQKHFEEGMAEEAEEKQLPVFQETRRWLDLYFSGEAPAFIPKMRPWASPAATPFRLAVWDILFSIPYGQTLSYGEIADRIAEKLEKPYMSPQAVGGAVGHNPFSLIIPCHRVIGSDDSLIGYAGGTDKKAALLELERFGKMLQIVKEEESGIIAGKDSAVKPS